MYYCLLSLFWLSLRACVDGAKKEIKRVYAVPVAGLMRSSTDWIFCMCIVYITAMYAIRIAIRID